MVTVFLFFQLANHSKYNAGLPEAVAQPDESGQANKDLLSGSFLFGDFNGPHLIISLYYDHI